MDFKKMLEGVTNSKLIRVWKTSGKNKLRHRLKLKGISNFSGKNLKFRFKTIKSKLFVLVTCILILSISTLAFFNYMKAEGFLVSSIERAIGSLAISSSKEISLWMVCLLMNW